MLLFVCFPFCFPPYSLPNVRWGHSVADIILAWPDSLTHMLPLKQWILNHSTSLCPSQTQNTSSSASPPPVPRSPSQRLPLGWHPEVLTLPWGPLATWSDRGSVKTVDAQTTSLRDIIRNFVALGQPVVIRNALLETEQCRAAMALWDKERFVESTFAKESKYNAYRIPYGE